MLTARKPAAGATAAAQLAGAALHVDFHALSVTDEASIRALRDDLAAHFGRLDVLVNNAGIITDTEAGRPGREPGHRPRDPRNEHPRPLRMAQMLLHRCSKALPAASSICLAAWAR